MRLVSLVALVISFVSALALPSRVNAQLYRATMMRAAPGRLAELVDATKARLSVYDAAGEPRPFVLRHSQGDQWDLMLLEPLGPSLPAYFAREEKRASAAAASGVSEAAWEAKLHDLASWREDEVVRGPALDVVQRAFEGNNFAHLEIFIALAGHYDALYKEREMENAFAKGIGRPDNMIFTRISGAAWDLFTIGNYRDMVHYATSAVVPSEREEAAARAAGFENRAAIGPYLRSHINAHHDNLLTVVR